MTLQIASQAYVALGLLTMVCIGATDDPRQYGTASMFLACMLANFILWPFVLIGRYLRS